MNHGGVDNGTTVVHYSYMNHGGSFEENTMSNNQETAQYKMRTKLDCMEWLKSRAAANHRTVNAEINHILEDCRRKDEQIERQDRAPAQ